MSHSLMTFSVNQIGFLRLGRRSIVECDKEFAAVLSLLAIVVNANVLFLGQIRVPLSLLLPLVRPFSVMSDDGWAVARCPHSRDVDLLLPLSVVVPDDSEDLDGYDSLRRSRGRTHLAS